MSCESFCWSPESFLKNSAVPEFAMVPRCAIGLLAASCRCRCRGCVSVPLSASASIQMASSASPASSSGLGERLEAQPVVGVGGVRDQLTQEDLPVAVQGMDHELQQLTDFGLETEGFFSGVGVMAPAGLRARGAISSLVKRRETSSPDLGQIAKAVFWISAWRPRVQKAIAARHGAVAARAHESSSSSQSKQQAFHGSDRRKQCSAIAVSASHSRSVAWLRRPQPRR